MALPKEPRQKMITIMYLVLTALLALNVSKQIVNAFVVINDGLQLTNSNMVSQNNSLEQRFEAAYSKDPIKTKPFLDAAKLVIQKSDAMVEEIQKEKVSLVKRVDGKPEWKDLGKRDSLLEEVDAKEDFTTPTGILCGTGEDPTKGEAFPLKIKLNVFRKDLMNVLKNPQICSDLSDSTKLNIGLKTPKPKPSASEGDQTWEYFYFGDAPLVSDVVTFTKMQTDVRNAESAMLNYLFSRIDANSFKVSSFIGKIIAPTYVTLSDSLKADIFASAVISTKPPKIEVGDSTSTDPSKSTGKFISTDANGVARYSVKTDKEGPEVVYGKIFMENPGTGRQEAYPFKTTYIVLKPSVVVSPSQMNVFYAGIPNPVDISAAGFDAGSLTASMSGGSISPSGARGHYSVNASADFIGRDAIVTVSAKMPDGSHRSLPPQHFHVKKIPDPTCSTAGRTGDVSMSKQQLQAVPMVKAQMPPDFDFQGVSFTVISFTMSIGVNGVYIEDKCSAPGGHFTSQMIQHLGQAPRGGYIIVKDVVVRGPDGRNRPIQGMAIKIS